MTTARRTKGRADKRERPKTVTVDGLTCVLLPGTKITRRARPLTGDILRASGQVQDQDFALYQQIALTGQLAMGQRQGNDPRRCYHQYGVLAMFPGFITRGPQLVTPTQTAIGAGFVTTRGAGFFEGNGQLILHGDMSSGAAGEPLLYWVGGTTTWTNGTLNADLTADVENITGVTFAEGRWWAVADQLQADAVPFNRITYKSDGTTATPTVWERANTDAANEPIGTIPFTADRLRFLEFAASTRMYPTTASLYSIAYVNASGRARLTGRATTDGGGWDDGANQEMASDAAPRGLKIMPAYDGVLDVIASTNVGLFRGNVSGAQQTAEELYRYSVRQGDYTGVMDMGADGNLYIADGPEVKLFRWLDGNGKSEILIFHLEVPTEALGDITAIAASKERPWLYVARGGLAASRNARIYVFDTNKALTDPDHAWFCIYRHNTVQVAITAMIESRENDGTTRLHFMAETSAGGDQEANLFANITTNPLELSTYAYAESGTILDSERKPLKGLTQVGFMAIQVDADSLSATKSVVVRDGQDGVAPANSQSVFSNTSPTQVWPDKTDATAGVGVAAKRQQVEFDLADSAANATAGPTLKELTITYLVKGLLPDNTTAEEFEFLVDLDATKRYGTNRDNPKNVLQSLQATADKMVLVPLVLDGGETVQVNVTLPETLIDPQLQAAVQQAPGGGVVAVRGRQLMR